MFSFEETFVLNEVVGNVRHRQTNMIEIARILHRHLLVQVDLWLMLVLVIPIAVRYVAFRCMTSPVTPAYSCGLKMSSLGLSDLIEDVDDSVALGVKFSFTNSTNSLAKKSSYTQTLTTLSTEDIILSSLHMILLLSSMTRVRA